MRQVLLIQHIVWTAALVDTYVHIMVLLSDISPHELAFSFISMKEPQYDGYQLFLSLENVVYSAITTPSDCFVPSNKQYICQKWNIVYTLYNQYTHDLFPKKH